MHPASLADDDCVDASALQELRQLQEPGEPGLVEDVVRVFLQDSVEQLSRAREELSRADLGNLARTAHQLKGSSSQVGAAEITRLAAALESTSKDGALESAAALVPQLECAFARARVVLERIAQGG